MTNHPSRSKKRARKAEALERLAQAFNEWLRRYTADPSSFAKESEVLGQFISDLNGGKEPSYGELQAAYLMKLMGELP